MKAVRGTESLYAAHRVWRGKAVPPGRHRQGQGTLRRLGAWFGHIGTGPGEGADRISRGLGFYVGPEGHILTTHAVVKG